MSVLVGGIAGSSSRLAGGLAAVGPMMVSDVSPTRAQVIPASLGTRLGKFRKILYDGVALPFTKNSSGVALPSCVVDAFRTSDDVKMDGVVSDASAQYEISVYTDETHYVVAYKAGSPDVAGTTVNTLVGQ